MGTVVPVLDGGHVPSFKVLGQSGPDGRVPPSSVNGRPSCLRHVGGGGVPAPFLTHLTSAHCRCDRWIPLEWEDKSPRPIRASKQEPCILSPSKSGAFWTPRITSKRLFIDTS